MPPAAGGEDSEEIEDELADDPESDEACDEEDGGEECGGNGGEVASDGGGGDACGGELVALKDAELSDPQPHGPLGEDMIPASQLDLIKMKDEVAEQREHLEAQDPEPIMEEAGHNAAPEVDIQMEASQMDVIEIPDTLEMEDAQTVVSKPIPDQMLQSREELEGKILELNKQLRHARYETASKLLGLVLILHALVCGRAHSIFGTVSDLN